MFPLTTPGVLWSAGCWETWYLDNDYVGWDKLTDWDWVKQQPTEEQKFEFPILYFQFDASVWKAYPRVLAGCTTWRSLSRRSWSAPSCRPPWSGPACAGRPSRPPSASSPTSSPRAPRKHRPTVFYDVSTFILLVLT